MQALRLLYQRFTAKLQERRPPRQPSQPLGTVKLVLRHIELPEPENVFVVLKCGPHWGKTATRLGAQAGKTPAWNWQVRHSQRRVSDH